MRVNICIGSANDEQPGMEYLVDWPDGIPLPSIGDTFLVRDIEGQAITGYVRGRFFGQARCTLYAVDQIPVDELHRFQPKVRSDLENHQSE